MASEGISSDVLKQQNFGLLLPKKSNLSFFGSGGGPARSEARRAGNLRGFAAPPSWRSAVGGGGCLLVSCTRLAPQHGALELLTAGAKVLRVPWHPRRWGQPVSTAAGALSHSFLLANYSWEMFLVPYAGF